MDEFSGIPEFGIKKENEERRDGGCGVVFDPETEKYAVGKLPNGNIWLFSGGVNPGEDMRDAVLREITEESGLYEFSHVEKITEAICHYHNSLKNVNRLAHATCYLVILGSTALVRTEQEEHEKFSLVWAEPEEIISNWESRNESKGYDHWIYFLKMSVNRAIELGYDKTSKNMI